MTPDERIAEEWKLLRTNRETFTSDWDDMDEALDALLTYTAALRDVAEAAEGVAEADWNVVTMFGITVHQQQLIGQLQAALQRWKGVAGK